jgi:aminopeptidase
MADPRIQRLAKLALGYSLDVKPGEEIGIQTSAIAGPLALELYAETLRRGAYPRVMISLDDQEEVFYSIASDEQLEHISPFTEFEIKNLDKIISVYSSHNLKALSNVDPEKQAKRYAAQAPLISVLMERYLSEWGRYLALPYPTSAMAQEAGMGVLEYEDLTYSACNVDKENPTEYWKKKSLEQDRLAKILNKIGTVRVVGEDTDLSLSTQGRTWENCDGHANLPDGEICTSPVEDTAEGRIRFTYPGVFQGREIEDISLTFKAGEVVEASAAKGEDLLQHMLKVDEGSRRLGEFAIGTNDDITRFTKNMLFDEKLANTIHLAIGTGLPTSGGENQSAIHWDILKDMRQGGKIFGDGKLIYEEGRFLI